MKKNKKMSDIQKITLIAALATVAIILNFIEIPYFIPYLKFDLSEVITLLALTFGFPIALCVAIIKSLFMMLNGSGSGAIPFIGEVTMFIGSLTIICSYYLSSKKFNKAVSLIIMSIIFVCVMTTINYFIITPLYFPESFNELVSSTLALPNGNEVTYLQYNIFVYVPFNLIKISIVSVVYYITSSIFDRLF